eukprot:2956953-Rhodomonas_salina.2
MELECCCADVRGGIGTGFFRDGHCSTGPTDEGRHTGTHCVCTHGGRTIDRDRAREDTASELRNTVVTEEFLTFSKASARPADFRSTHAQCDGAH